MLVTIVAFVAILIVLVVVHELGHFLTARAAGVKVDEFGLGFPPRIWGIKKGETLYSINAIPLGGFVKLAGEEDPKIARSLASKSAGVRIGVLAAGAIMNLLLPLVLFSIAFMVPHITVTEPIIIQSIASNSPASRAGLQPGDQIISVNKRQLSNTNDMQRNIQINLGNLVTLVAKHTDGTTQEIKLIPRWNPPAGQGAVGIQFDVAAIQVGRLVSTRAEPFWRAIPMGVTEAIEAFLLFKNGIVSMIIGASPVSIVGPVGVAQITGEVARAGISPLLEFAAFFSINLGIVNLFPLPALDGGRIAFVILERIRRGKRVSPKTEGLIHFIGFSLLLAVILVVTYNDVIRIMNGANLVP